MTPAEKTSVLVAALNERYEALRIIRARVQDVCLWTMGIFFGASGWLIGTHPQFEWATKIVFLVVLALVLLVLHRFYLEDLIRGFRSQQKVAAKIEEALGLFTPEFFGVGGTIYPKEWPHAGTSRGKGQFFGMNLTLVYFAGGLLTLCILFTGILF